MTHRFSLELSGKILIHLALSLRENVVRVTIGHHEWPVQNFPDIRSFSNWVFFFCFRLFLRSPSHLIFKM